MTDKPSGAARRARGWVAQAVVVVAVLSFIAHARHQSIPQLFGSAASRVSAVVDPHNGIFSEVGPGAAMPQITVAPTSGTLPAKVTVSGTGFKPGEKVEVSVHTTVLSTVTADTAGAFTTVIRVRADEFCPHHQCEVLAEGKDSIRWTTTPYDLTD